MSSGLNYSTITEGTNVGDPFNVNVVRGNPPSCTPGGSYTGCSSRTKCKNFMIERARNRKDSMDCVGDNCTCRDGGRSAPCQRIKIPTSMSNWHAVTERNYYDPSNLDGIDNLEIALGEKVAPGAQLKRDDPWGGFDYLGENRCYDRAEDSETGPIQVIAPAPEIQDWYDSAFNEAIADDLKKNYKSEDKENCKTKHYYAEAGGGMQEMDGFWWSEECDKVGEETPESEISICGEAARQVIMPYIENYTTSHATADGSCPRYIMFEYSNMTESDPSSIYNNWKDS